MKWDGEVPLQHTFPTEIHPTTSSTSIVPYAYPTSPPPPAHSSLITRTDADKNPSHLLFHDGSATDEDRTPYQAGGASTRPRWNRTSKKPRLPDWPPPIICMERGIHPANGSWRKLAAKYPARVAQRYDCKKHRRLMELSAH